MSAWVWIDASLVSALHERLLLLHGGAPGLRDEALLLSALARPQQRAAYADTVDIAGLAAAYTFGLVRNHPFIDGNKRTGFVVGVLFLELNGASFVASEEDATRAALALAEGSATEAEYAAFLRGNTRPP